MIELDNLCMHCMGQLNHSNEICPHCGADPALNVNAANQLECGTILAGTYLVGCVLGQGGFGITYIGLDLNLNQKVAIKEYYPAGFVTREGQTRTLVVPLPGKRMELFERGKEKFLNEAQILAKFSDEPSIVDVRGFFLENGTAYIVMKFVEGVPLNQYANQNGGKLPAKEVLKMMEPLFSSLSKVHAEGLLHRDISPDNIMRKKNGTLVLIDFGAARQMSIDGEHSNTINVKHGFAPEEQYRTHGEQGPWTDVYALCATIYRLTTGVTPQQALDRAMSDVPLLPPNKLGADFTPAQQQAILHGLAVRASRRTQSIEQLCDELKSLSVQQQNEDNNDGLLPGHERVKPVKRDKQKTAWWKSKYALSALTAVLVLLIGLPLLISKKQSADSEKVETQIAAAVETEAPAQPTPDLNPLPDVGSAFYGHLAAGTQYSAALNLDGTVSVYGGNNSEIHASGWHDIVQIAGYGDLLVGLCADGTVVATGTDTEHLTGEYQSWQNIQAIEAGYQSVSALDASGYVLYDGTNYQDLNECENWRNISLLVRGDEHMVGVTADGKLLDAGMNNVGQRDVAGISNVLDAATSCQSTYILKRDGTVQIVGGNPEYEEGQASAANWIGVIAISSGDRHVIGLRVDGFVLKGGDNEYGQCNVDGWRNIIAICAGHRHTIALDRNGVLHMTGSNKYGQTTGDGDTILRD